MDMIIAVVIIVGMIAFGINFLALIAKSFFVLVVSALQIVWSVVSFPFRIIGAFFR